MHVLFRRVRKVLDNITSVIIFKDPVPALGKEDIS